jgi:hypothetical protein
MIDGINLWWNITHTCIIHVWCISTIYSCTFNYQKGPQPPKINTNLPLVPRNLVCIKFHRDLPTTTKVFAWKWVSTEKIDAKGHNHRRRHVFYGRLTSKFFSLQNVIIDLSNQNWGSCRGFLTIRGRRGQTSHFYKTLKL